MKKNQKWFRVKKLKKKENQLTLRKYKITKNKKRRVRNKLSLPHFLLHKKILINYLKKSLLLKLKRPQSSTQLKNRSFIMRSRILFLPKFQ